MRHEIESFGYRATLSFKSTDPAPGWDCVAISGPPLGALGIMDRYQKFLGTVTQAMGLLGLKSRGHSLTPIETRWLESVIRSAK